MSNPLRPHGLYSPWNFPGQNTGVGSLSLLQEIFPTQGLNQGLPNCRRILYQPTHQRRPRTLEWVTYPFSRGSSRARNWTGVSCIAGRFFTNFPGSSVGKASASNAGDLGSIPGSGRSPGEGNGNPPQYSCLENPMDRWAWQATVHGMARVGYNLALFFLYQLSYWGSQLPTSVAFFVSIKVKHKYI